jgi:hypothetical protein
MRRTIVALSFALLLAPSSALADDDDPRAMALTLTAFGTLGMLGSLSVDGAEVDLAVSYGGGFQLDVPLQRYVSAAAIVRTMAWSAQTNDPRSLLLDLLVAPRLRFPIAFGKQGLAIPFLQVPIGLSHLFGEESNGEDAQGSPNEQAFAIGVGLGAIILLSESFGLSLELGWLRRSYSTSYSQYIVTSGVGIDVEVDADITISEAYFQPGLTIAF